MTFFARAVVTGFALSLGAAIFKKLQSKLGLGEAKDDKSSPDVGQQGAASDPSLQAT